MNIGDLFLRLVADDSTFQAEVAKSAQSAGDKGAAVLGKSISSGFKTTAVKAFGGAAASAFALASKGALDLEDVQVDLQRETGLTADAAKDAAKQINAIAGRNVTDIQAVADAFAKVHNDLGLTGQAALDTTEAFVQFGRATKQGPAAAVAAFDDILDAWNLSADHSQEIMDKLVVSHQKYGGSIEDNEAALSKLAPQLQALNATIDDGIGLLNLFATKGLDASQATFALNTAVKNLKPGQSLNDLIKQISAIEDPTKRAQEAIKVFGARGGVALANALHPGITSLAEFEISASDAAGATKKAADAIDSSVRGQIAKALSVAGAALRGFGSDFGPALTGLASLTTLAAAVAPGFGGKFAGALSGGIRKVVGSAPVRAAATAVGAFIGATLSLAVDAATKLANVITDALSALVTKSGVRAASIAAGTFLGGIFGTAYGAASDATQAVAGVISGLAGGRVSAIATAAGQSLGVKFGTGILVGLTGLAFFKTIEDALPKPAGMQDFFDSYTKGAQGAAGAADDLTAANAQLSSETEAATAAMQTQDRESLNARRSFSGYGDSMKAAAALFSGGAEVITVAAKDVSREVQARMRLAAIGITNFANQSDEATAAWRKHFRDDLFTGIDSVRAAREGIDGQFAQLESDLKNFGSRTGREAHDVGQLASKELQKALHSGIPLIRQEAQGVQLAYLDELQGLVRAGDKIGKKGMKALEAAIHSENPEVARVAAGILATIRSRIDKPSVGSQAGHGIGGSLASSLLDKGKPVSAAARHLRRLIEANLPSVISTTIRVVVHYQPGGKGFYAKGGIIPSGSVGFVGEEGIERAEALPGGGVRITPLTGSRMPTPHLGFTPPQVSSTAGSVDSSITIGSIVLNGVGSDVSPAAAKRFGRMVGDETAANFRRQGARIGLHVSVP